MLAALLTGCATTPPPRYPAPVVQPIHQTPDHQAGYNPPGDLPRAGRAQPVTEPLAAEALPHQLPSEPLPPGASSSPYGVDPIPSTASLPDVVSPEFPAIEGDVPKESTFYDAGAPIASVDTTPKPPESPKFFTVEAPPPVVALETEIESSFKGHNYKNAAAQLERAIRIQPKNPELWHVLAEVRLRERQPGLAEDLAKKSNAMAKNQPDLIRNNWIIIAEARRQRGDFTGSSEAAAKAW